MLESATAAPVAAPQSASAPAPLPADEASILEWSRWLAECKLTGMAQQLAYNAELKAHRRASTGVELDLMLSESNRHLAERGYQDKLSEVLRTLLGHPVRINVEIAGTGETSMAAQERRARQALQDKATATFTADPFVQDAMRLFDARIRPQSIQPVTSQQGTKS